jgi:hypothetical protein
MEDEAAREKTGAYTDSHSTKHILFSFLYVKDTHFRKHT